MRDVRVTINIPAGLMPDALVDLRPPADIVAHRHINETTGEGQIVYKISNLRPYDCILVPEPLVLRSNEFTEGSVPNETYCKIRFALPRPNNQDDL